MERDSLQNTGRTSKLGKLVNKGAEKMKVKTSSNYRSYGTDATGNVVETKTKINRDGSKTITRSDDFGSISTMYSADGRVIGTQISYSRAMRNLVSAKGTVNQVAIAAFVQNSLLSEKEKQLMIVNMLVKSRMQQYAGGQLNGRFKDRNITNGVDAEGNNFIEITQHNEDGTITSFNATFKGNRVMTSIITVGKDRKGVAYATDGIVQRKTHINGENVQHQYSVADAYSNETSRPVFMNGDLSSNIQRKDILFSQEDMDRFTKQVVNKGNKAYHFSEFK